MKLLLDEINNAFLRFESFVNGNTNNYKYFGFRKAFAQLFEEAYKPENFSVYTCELLLKYIDYIQYIVVYADIDRSVDEDEDEDENISVDLWELETVFEGDGWHKFYMEEDLNLPTSIKDIVNFRPQKRSINKLAYKWQNSPDKELPELYHLMINEYKLIASETTYEQFKAVFSGQPIESIKPIKWHQDNASELLYFIDRLEQSNNIASNPKKADYLKLAACFVKPNGEFFKANWKQIKQNISIKAPVVFVKCNRA